MCTHTVLVYSKRAEQNKTKRTKTSLTNFHITCHSYNICMCWCYVLCCFVLLLVLERCDVYNWSIQVHCWVSPLKHFCCSGKLICFLLSKCYFEKLNVDETVCIHVWLCVCACRSLTSDSSETIKVIIKLASDMYENASRVNYIDLDLHSVIYLIQNVLLFQKVFKHSPSSLLWR